MAQDKTYVDLPKEDDLPLLDPTNVWDGTEITLPTKKGKALKGNELKKALAWDKVQREGFDTASPLDWMGDKMAAGAAKAIFPLMSRKTQDKFIEDYARKMANHYVGTLSGPTGDVVRSLDGAYHDRVGFIDDISAELEKRIKALPEKQQDAVVATLMTIDPKKFTFGGDQSFARSLYNQGHNPTLINISSMDASTPEQFAKTFLHEVSHPMDNQFDPIYAYQRYVNDELPENIKTAKRSVREGIGDEMSKEQVHTGTMNSFGHPSNIAVPEEEHNKLSKIMPDETLTMIEDDLSMVPIPGTGKKWKSPGKKVYSHHEETYPYETQQTSEYEMAQSGLDPKSLPLKTRKNAARSVEGWANYTPAMSSESAQEGTRKLLPKTSSKIDAILEKDPRRPFAIKFVPSEYWGAEGERELLPEIDWSLYK